MTASLQALRTTTNTPPAPLLPGEFFVELGPFTKLWIGSASGNRLLLSSDPADVTESSPRYLQVAGGTMLGALVLAADAANPLEPVALQQLDAALTAITIAAARYLNHVDNSGFRINQRAFAGGALGAGAYGHDRWKAGASGCTYTFTQSPGPATTITITAGTLGQVVEGMSLAGGGYVLSWTGTAQGRVGAGAYAVSPVTVTGIAAGADTTIEFNTGTLGQVKLEAGSLVTGWVAEATQQVLAKCQRFYQVLKTSNRGPATGPGNVFSCTVTFPPMRTTPIVVPGAADGSLNVSAATFYPMLDNAGRFSITAVSAGDCYSIGLINALSADL